MRYESARLTGFSVSEGKEKRGGVDFNFLLLVLLLLAMGVVMVLSSSYARAYYDPGHVTGGNAAYYFIRQLLYACFGVALMLLASRLPMGFYRRYAFPFLLVTLLLLALVPLIGVRANGSRRWLWLGPLPFQPSEFAKYALAASGAAGGRRSGGGRVLRLERALSQGTPAVLYRSLRQNER